MPKKSIDYSKTIIYKITCNDPSVLECYVGHTTNFIKRKYSHKSSCVDETKNFKVYQMIRDNGGWNNWTMVPICEFPCENFTQALIKEESCRVELQASLNTYKCLIAEPKQYQREYHKEYYKYHKEYYKEYNILYYQEHKEEISEKAKIYNQKNKEEIAEQKKIYNQKNKEKIAEKSKEYYKQHKEHTKINYEVNKDKINEQRRLRYAQKKLVQNKTK
jgi:hypothetical protein